MRLVYKLTTFNLDIVSIEVVFATFDGYDFSIALVFGVGPDHMLVHMDVFDPTGWYDFHTGSSR